MKKELQFILPMPPTDNHIYATVGKRKRVLTAEAKQFQVKVSGLVSDAMTWETESFDETDPLAATIIVFLKAIENKGWPKNTKKRFKKIDLQNRQKLVIDSVMDALGLPDENIMKVNMKKATASEPHVLVRLEPFPWV